MESYSKVGMQELDQRLSKIVEAARKKPVSVYRYGAPWVWIVSQEDWQGALKEVSSYIPPGHSLALLKPQIESLLGEEAKVLSALARTAASARCCSSSKASSWPLATRLAVSWPRASSSCGR